MSRTASFIEALREGADEAAAAETSFRREAVERIAALECQRTFAFRRLNLMRAVADGIGAAEDEEIAAAAGVGILRSRLDWTGGSDAQEAILSRFAAVARTLFASRSESEEPGVSTAQALAEFETWYEQSYRAPFWALFEQPIEETPRVDF